MGTVYLDRMDNRIDGIKEIWAEELERTSPDITGYETIGKVSRNVSVSSRSLSLEDVATGTRINVLDILGKKASRIAISLSSTTDTVDLYINPISYNHRPNETGPNEKVSLWPISGTVATTADGVSTVAGTCNRGVKVSITDVEEWISTEDLGENHVPIESVYVDNVSGTVNIIIF